MNDKIKKDLLSGMFAGASFEDSVIVGIAEPGSIVFYKQGSEERKKPTNDQIARAIAAINGKDNVLRNFQDWLGVCCLLSSKYDFPIRLEDCVSQILELPFANGDLEVECKYDNIRRFTTNKFVGISYERWGSYVPNDTERTLFQKCFTVARALDNEIEKQLKES